jgi:uncharacterized protein (TIGR02147 family)
MNSRGGAADAPVTARPDIYSFHDYRKFLLEQISYLRTKNPDFSIRYLARHAGLSPAYFSMIIKGIRGFSDKTLEDVLPHLGLNPSERSYFRLLCVVADAPNPKEKIKALSRIQTFRTYKKQNPNETEVYQYLTKWYYVAIREMVPLPGFKLEPKWIQQRLARPVLIGEIKKAIKFLMDHGLIAVKPDGSAFLPDRNLDCKDGIFQIALREFHKQMLSLASDSIENATGKERIILGHTFAISEEAFGRLREILEEALKRSVAVNEAPDRPGPKRVYHVTLAGFPISKEGTGEGQ